MLVGMESIFHFFNLSVLLLWRHCTAVAGLAWLGGFVLGGEIYCTGGIYRYILYT